jgi:hypothetical protein
MEHDKLLYQLLAAIRSTLLKPAQRKAIIFHSFSASFSLQHLPSFTKHKQWLCFQLILYENSIEPQKTQIQNQNSVVLFKKKFIVRLR